MANCENQDDPLKEPAEEDNEAAMEAVASHSSSSTFIYMAPHVVRSAVHRNNETTETEGHVEGESEGTVCPFFLAGRCRFGEKCRNTHTGLSEDSGLSPLNKEKSGKGKRVSEPKGKKPPMKTATDVISRIQWDTHLPKESFAVGYLDRFLGTIEKPFSSFCWEDLSSLGTDVLAIPKHRIQYFKYRDLLVWEKATRTDNVFGSSGSGLTILDIIDRYDTLRPTEKEDTGEQGHAEVLLNQYEEYKDDSCLEVHEPKKLRPTHFIAVRITSEDVRHSVKEIQNVLLKHHPAMSEFCIPVPELHLTLCLLHLESSEDMEVAHTVLQELKCETQRILPPSLILSFERLKDFHSRVLYLEPLSVPGLPNFVHTLSQSFRSKGLMVIDPPQANSFHLTVAKVPRNVASQNPSLRFLPEVYNAIQLGHFGAQHVDSLSFCYAGGSRRTDGFYTTLLELPLY